MGARSVSRTIYYHQLVTSEDSRDICYSLPACIAVVSANSDLPVWTALPYLPIETLFFYPAVEAFQAPENQSKDHHCRALSRGWLGTSSLLVVLRCCTTSGTFLSSWLFIVPSIYCRKAFRGVLCFAQEVFISRKLQVSTLEEWWGVRAYAYCSYIPDSFILHACTEVTFYCQF